MITCGPYILKDTLGKGGYATVKLAEHSETGKECALKIMRKKDMSKTSEEMFKNEVSIMKELDHQNLIKILDFSEEAEYTIPDGRSMEVCYIALELAKGGEIFDFIAETGRFSESTARFYFRRIIDGIEYMHKNGIFHRDVKPENILLDANFELKITDFGFSSKEEVCTVRKGTTSYMGPEMFLKDEFESAPLDIFAAGIVLFIMLKAAPPFNLAKMTDPHYKLFNTNPQLFWKIHFRKFKTDLPSGQVKDLISKMMAADPEDRITLEEIREHEWFNGPMPTEEEILAEFTERKAKLDNSSDMEE